MATADWIKEAEEQAKKYSDSIKSSNQYLIDQLNQARDNSLAQLEQQQNAALEKLQKQQDNAIYNLNSQKSDIYRTANDNAQQLNINRLLNLKDNQYAMNRAGLGNQGLVGSQVNSINNAYGKDLTSVLNQRTRDLNNLALQLQNTNLGYDTGRIDLGNTYSTNRANLINQYDSNLANLQREIENQALNQYNNIYNNYLAMKQAEAELALKQAAQEEAKRQWQAEFDFAVKQSKSSKSSGGGGAKKVTSKVGGFINDTPVVTETPTTPKSTSLADIIANIGKNAVGIVNTGSSGSSVNTSNLKNTGKVSSVFTKLPSGIKGSSQIKTDGKKYYVVDNKGNYIDVTSKYNESKKKGMILNW